MRRPSRVKGALATRAPRRRWAAATLTVNRSPGSKPDSGAGPAARTGCGKGAPLGARGQTSAVRTFPAGTDAVSLPARVALDCSHPRTVAPLPCPCALPRFHTHSKCTMGFVEGCCNLESGLKAPSLNAVTPTRQQGSFATRCSLVPISRVHHQPHGQPCHKFPTALRGRAPQLRPTQRVIDLARHPQPVQQHRQLPHHGRHRPPLQLVVLALAR